MKELRTLSVFTRRGISCFKYSIGKLKGAEKIWSRSPRAASLSLRIGFYLIFTSISARLDFSNFTKNKGLTKKMITHLKLHFLSTQKVCSFSEVILAHLIAGLFILLIACCYRLNTVALDLTL